ncbi:MAG: hypothetical protein ACXU8N_20905 [Telluria sp.]
MNMIHNWRAALLRRTSPYQPQLAALPPGLMEYWQHTAPQEYPGIPTDAFFFARAAEGLLQFFRVVARTRKSCALPSVAADSVWHAWLRWNPGGPEAFARSHFGLPVPHIERAGLSEGALANTLLACRKLEGIPAEGPRVPSLFLLDARLRMPGGHGYWRRGAEVAFAPLDERGRRDRAPSLHPELALATLVAAGFVSEAAYAELLRRQRTDSGSLCGASCGSADGCSDGGGSACGSSCGSSCGGGCGGGCGS